MNRNVSPLVVVLAIAALALALFVSYRYYAQPATVAHPGAEDIPPRIPGHDKPVAPPPEAGPAPGTMKR